jgi:subtilisin family serine protease
MRRTLSRFAPMACALGAVLTVRSSDARPPNGLGVIRILGNRAEATLAPNSGSIGALVAIPSGQTASGLGVIEVVPGIGRISGSAATLLAFGGAHPTIPLEVTPPLHTLLANAQFITHAALARETRGANGQGAAVGIVDTGIDPTLPDFRDPVTQNSRIAWMLDLSMPPLNLHPDLEKQFGILDSNGNVVQGAVLTGSDIDTLIAQGLPQPNLPTDVNGHGTHVASIAAGNGGGTSYIGMAPSAALVIVRATRDTTGSFEDNDVITGASFVFNRAAAMGVPLAANFSIGTDFGSHDGNSLWEQALAAFAGSTLPGHAIVAAAGNSGSIVDTPIHQGIEVTGARVAVPIVTQATSGSVQVWVALRAGADIDIGLDGPDGTWVAPVSNENESGHNTSAYQSGVIYGSNVPNTQIPQGSNGAIVVWSGTWPSGTYAITLEGHGYADLYLEGLGAAALPQTFFTGAVRDATVTLPASSAGIIAAGCTIDSPSWMSALGESITITEPILDAYGGLPQMPLARQPVANGEICDFSSAGPTLIGVPKPDILAPGGIVIGALSQQALPGSPNSIFTGDCPSTKQACSSSIPCTGGFTCGSNGFCTDPACTVVDQYHAVASGTSMSSPMVTGIVALLFQQDPTLTQDVVRALLQAGAHRARGAAPFFDQDGPGEVDALGALEALTEMTTPDTALPDPSQSWMTLSEDFALADGSTPITAMLELRTTTNTRATVFDSSRLQAIALVNGNAIDATIVRTAAPGLFTFTVLVPLGNANGSLTLGATFDGAPIVQSVTIPIALDSWTAGYPASASSGGGCTLMRGTGARSRGDSSVLLLFVGLLALRRRSR